FVVIAQVGGGAEEVHVAAEASEVLVEFGVEAAGRVLVVVERVVGNRVADQGGQRRTAGQFDTNWQRRFAVLEAIVVRTNAGTNALLESVRGLRCDTVIQN